ncbi:MAG: hypothetical protein HY543_08290 [Deltaproteobacteria bacterium]|nr:hypothetical protein [Deltaproteobacteria bacterium]
MLTARRIRQLFDALNDELATEGIQGEIGLCGGAVMCLVFKARAATKDIDGIFAPTEAIRAAGVRIAKRFGLAPGWLNDAAKAFFLADPPRRDVLAFSHLRIGAPTAQYMLAMKCIAARFDTHDRTDAVFLIKHLRLRSPKEVFAILEDYYPRKRISPKTQFLVEEIFERRRHSP